MVMQSINPFDGETIREYEEFNPDHIGDALEKADAAYSDWRRRPFAERAELMKKAARILENKADEFARLMAMEMGKPVTEGRAEAKKCAWVCDYYAENAEAFLKPEPVDTGNRSSYVHFSPLGPVLAVMPWNYPFWQVFRFAAPALMVGNTGLLKHASNVCGCALAIEEVFREAGFPESVFQTLLLRAGHVDKVIEHPLCRAVTLTGSTPAGRAVAAKAGEMLKKSVLELGGSDPYVVLEDADLDETVNICIKSRLLNSGQSCIAAKRFIVVSPLLDDFERLYTERMSHVKMGDPLLEDTEVGPQARADLRDELHGQVEKSLKEGARRLLGGEIPPGPGAFYPPTVLSDVKPGMPAHDEELFGPVAAILGARDEADAIRAANRSPFGLGAAVFTRDVERGERIAAEELEAGCCFVNDFVKSDPRLPFGGIKESGYGRELSHFGIKEFMNVKTVLVK